MSSSGKSNPYASPESIRTSPDVEHVKRAKGQPSGLWVLFITEMWERFNYYGMRALLVLYLISKTSGENPGFGWDKADASIFYGWYTFAVYLTPILGGWLADRLLGTHRSMLLGGWIIALGEFALAGTELWGHNTGTETITLFTAPGPFLSFIGGLTLIAIGTGFFKPCVSVMVGQLYAADDPRRDSGFTIFYMGINVGAFLSGVVAGTLGEKIAWHWGFFSAGVGMVLGLLVYLYFRPFYLQGIGLPPHHRPEHEEGHEPTPEEIEQAKIDEYERTRPITRVDWDRITVILILSLFAVVFWAGFEQAGSSMNVFAKDQTDRTLPWLSGVIPESWYKAVNPFPATWYQSVNPAAIVIFAPLVAWFWILLAKRKIQPSTPVKFGIAFLLMSAGYVAMVFGALDAHASGKAGPQWLLITYVVATWGELCLSPVGLSMVTKLSPARYTSMMMGLYFFFIALANLSAGYFASYAEDFAKRGEDGHGWLAGQADFFLILAVVPAIVGVIVLLLSPAIKRMMHGLH
ncbi:MAG TPA: peptide MFS transporter [Thermoguttaceae bacterium]|nr:peptide MFS transporter [Thermoguttaceae bacterium]